jgi:uncharacterized protein with beta-barrel porin domain
VGHLAFDESAHQTFNAYDRLGFHFFQEGAARMSDPKAAWDRVGDEMSNLGKKLQEHLDQSGPKSEAAAEAQNALHQMAAAIDGALEGVGKAARDEGVRDTATKVAQSFRDALAASLKKAGENLRGDDSRKKGESP